jgi:hypothetical protein
MLTESDVAKLRRYKRFRKWRWLAYALSLVILFSALSETYQAWVLCRWYGMSLKDLISAGGAVGAGLSLSESYHGYWLRAGLLYQEALRDFFVSVAVAGVAYDYFRCQDLALRTYKNRSDREAE